MQTNHETFWNHGTFAVIGHSTTRPFPVLTYGKLKKLGKKVFPIDTTTSTILGDRTYPDIASLPEKVDAVVLEVLRPEAKAWVQQVADAGIKDLWFHMSSDTPEALAIAKEHGINARTGTCAVMYVTPGFSFHSIHKWIQKIRHAY